MKKTVFRLTLILLPIFIWFAFQLALPLNQYTFRSWEALIVGPGWWSASFYPDQKIDSEEVGDLVPYTEDAILRHARWETDSLGYRNADSVRTGAEAIVIGDSTSIGTGLSQEDTLAEQVSRDSGLCVRSYGGKLKHGLKQAYESGLHPKWVILTVLERAVGDIAELQNFELPSSTEAKWNPRVWIQLKTLWSRFRKNVYWNYRASHGIKDALIRTFAGNETRNVSIAPSANETDVHPKMRFMGATETENLSEDQISSLIQKLNRLAHTLSTQNAKLIFSIVPNKESIYSSPSRSITTQFQSRFNQTLKSPDFIYIDLFALYSKGYQEHGTLYHWTDDSHWNREGVQVLSRELKKRIAHSPEPPSQNK